MYGQAVSQYKHADVSRIDVLPRVAARMNTTPVLKRRLWPHSLLPLDAGGLLSVVFLCFGPVIYAAPLGTVAALLLMTLTVGFLAYRDTGFPSARILASLALFAPLVGWMLLSSLWALDRQAAFLLALKLAVLFAAAAALTHCFASIGLVRLKPALRALAAGLAFASLLVLIDLHFNGMIGRLGHRSLPPDFDPARLYGRGATIHAVLLVPILLGLRGVGAWRLGILQAAIGIVCIFATASLSAKVALGSGIVAAAAVYLVPRLRWGFLGLLALGVAALPLVLPVRLDPETACWLANHKPSALHRVYIWNFSAERIHEHPVAGWGLDAARRIPGGNGRVVVQTCAPLPPATVIDNVVMPLHTHDAILQDWLELGGVGALLTFGLLILLLARAYRAPAWQTRPSQAALAGGTLAGLSIALVSFGIWQEWFIAALAVATAVSVFAARARGAAACPEPRRTGRPIDQPRRETAEQPS
jgi:O-antigen ligase